VSLTREDACRQISDDLLTIAPALGKSVNNLLMNTIIAPIRGQLSPSDFAIMKTLHGVPEAHISEVAGWLLIPRPQMTRIVEKLVRLGYISREDDAADRRWAKIKLTDTGRQLYEEWEHKAACSTGDLLNELTDVELQELAESLGKFRESITRIVVTHSQRISKLI